MNLRKLHLPSIGVLGLLVGGFLRVLAFAFEWPIFLVILSQVVLLIGVGWTLMFDVFPIFLEPFYQIRRRFSRRLSFFFALLVLFFLLQILTNFLPSGPTKDITTTFSFLSFVSALVWCIAAYVLGTFTPVIRLMKRRPREVEKVTFADVVTSMAIIFIPTVILSFVLSPTGLNSSSVSPYQAFLSSLLTDSLMGLYLFLLVIRPRVFTWRQLGLRRVDREDFGHAFVLFVFFAVVIFIVEMFLRRVGVQVQQYSFSSDYGRLYLLLVEVLVTPIVEELYFRGFLFKGLLIHNKLWVAYLTSALLFAVLHPPIIVMVEVFFIGLLLAYMVKETKSIWPGVLIHMLNNALVFGYLLFR